MRIKVEFEHQWTIEDVEAYLKNPFESRFSEMDEKERLELTVCACHYLIWRKDITDQQMIIDAQEDLGEGIEEMVYDSNIFHRLLRAYQEEIEEEKEMIEK